MNIPFKIKFTIFDENRPLTKKQIKIKNNLIDMNDMKKILKNVISGLNDVKFLDRCEPSICSLDEKNNYECLFVIKIKNINIQYILIKTIHYVKNIFQLKN